MSKAPPPRPHGGRWAGLLLLGAAALAFAPGCSSDDSSAARSTTTSSAAPEPVVATVPPVPSGVEDCGVQDALAGWPTTMIASPTAYACIVDALADGTPAQMSSITAREGDSGRKTSDGYAIPVRRIVTWVVVGPNEVEETVDRTEEGGPTTTRTCAAFTEAGYGTPISGTDCS